jgi:TAG lipase/lysophosphatidylethanolamine acyltransferase
MSGLLTAIWRTLCDVLLFWQTASLALHVPINDAKCLQQFFSWLTRKRPVELWSEILRDAKNYEDWEEASFQLDVLSGNDLW